MMSDERQAILHYVLDGIRNSAKSIAEDVDDVQADVEEIADFLAWLAACMERNIFARIADIWPGLRESCWDCADGLLWLKDFEPRGAVDRKDFVDASAAYITAVDVHTDSVNYWRAQLRPYKGREYSIPREWAIVVNDDGVVDGYHRVTAAYLEYLEALPTVEERPC